MVYANSEVPGPATLDDLGGPVASAVVPRVRARRSDRCDFGRPVELPAGPAGDGRRFARTRTMDGGHEGSFGGHRGGSPTKPDAGRDMLVHNPPGRATRPSSAPTRPGVGVAGRFRSTPADSKNPYLHADNSFRSTGKPAGRLNNTIWGHMPDV